MEAQSPLTIDEVDEASQESFPASDPPAWTLGTEPHHPHEHEVAKAFDGQAAEFERAPVQTDPVTLQRLVAFAGFPKGARLADVGCGPGLVSGGLLAAGHSVHGFDLSAEMIARARKRNAAYGNAASFEQRSIHTVRDTFDGIVSRFVLHHVPDPEDFVHHQISLLRPGGVLVLSDHLADADPIRAAHHNEIELLRDRSHTQNLSGGAIVDLFATLGLGSVASTEYPFELDFDEWYDRGTPGTDKETVRARLLAGTSRGFAPTQEGGKIRIACVLGMFRGVKAA